MNEKEIIKIASNTNFFGLSDNYEFKAKYKNKNCGDIIEVEVNKNIDQMRFETNSCIFTQASAAILANNFIKIYRLDLKKIIIFIQKKLNGEQVKAPIKIKELDFLINKKNKNRKDCITLPYYAVIKALNA